MVGCSRNNMEGINEKPKVYLPFDLLPESIKWSNGKNYRVKVVLRQTGSDEKGANFEIVDANSLEPTDENVRKFMVSEGGFIPLRK